jgi:hypothetical protein
VGVGRVRDLEASRRGLGDLTIRDARRIDDERTTVTEIHEIRRVAETLVHERPDLDHAPASCGRGLILRVFTRIIK